MSNISFAVNSAIFSLLPAAKISCVLYLVGSSKGRLSSTCFGCGIIVEVCASALIANSLPSRARATSGAEVLLFSLMEKARSRSATPDARSRND